MKRTMVAFVLLLLACSARAQTITMSQGDKPALTADLLQTTVKFAEKEWKKFIKEFSYKDYNRDKKNNEWKVEKAKLPAIGGASPVDLFVRFDEVGENVQMMLWIDLGGSYVNANDVPDKYAEAQSLLKRFGLQVERSKTQERLDEENDKLKELESKLKKLVRHNESLHGDIDDYKEKIRKAEANIETNVKDQAAMKKAIEDQKKVADEIKKKLDNLKN